VILYIMLTGTPPFNGRNDREILQRVQQGKYSVSHPAFKIISDDARDLLDKMLTFDSVKRPSAQQCYDHPWFKKQNHTEKGKLDLSTMENFKNFQVTPKFYG
jgi:calcium-dependent protein kinase